MSTLVLAVLLAQEKYIHREMCNVAEMEEQELICYLKVIDGSNVIPNRAVHKKTTPISVGLLSNINLHVISLIAIARDNNR